jgi:glycosyltransferase involved in cell wall biosynthesis
VIVTGEVADVRPWLAAAAVVVVPLAIARGIQNKLLEAMAMGRPVVASAAAFAGIDALPGRDLIVADGADQAEAVIRLLADASAAAAMGAAARRQIVARYAWDEVLAELPALLDGRERVRERVA